MAVSALLERADKNIQAVTPPALLEQKWEPSVCVHKKSKSLLVRWTSGEIKSPQVASELAPLLAGLERTITESESMFGKEFYFDPVKMAGLRQEVLNAVNEFFVTPTP
jgi:hypothetical protein